MYPWVIFDLDGTLLNTLEELAYASNWVCKQNGWPTHPVEAYKAFVGSGTRKLVERFSPREMRTPQRLQAAWEQFSRYYSTHKEEHTMPYWGMPELVGRLKETGISVAVLTNKPQSAASEVVAHYYPGLFSLVQGAMDGMPVKPNPTLLRQLLSQMGAEPQKTLFVGDSDVDIRTAKNGRLASCGVLWGFRDREELLREGADYLAATSEELEALVLGQSYNFDTKERLGEDRAAHK